MEIRDRAQIEHELATESAKKIYDVFLKKLIKQLLNQKMKVPVTKKLF